MYIYFQKWIRFSRMVRASDCHAIAAVLGSIPASSADEAVLKTVQYIQEKFPEISVHRNE
jgi:hypothetical protein